MNPRVAYAIKENIKDAIKSGKIPKGTMIITKDKYDPEFLFYDTNGNLKTVTEKTKFETLTDAQEWTKKYNCVGCIFTVHNGSKWLPYLVDSDNTLTPLTNEITDIGNVKIIDGGNSTGI